MIKVENGRFEARGSALELINDISVAVGGIVEALEKRLGRDFVVEQIKGAVEIELLTDEEAEKYWEDICKKDPEGAAFAENISKGGFLNV